MEVVDPVWLFGYEWSVSVVLWARSHYTEIILRSGI